MEAAEDEETGMAEMAIEEIIKHENIIEVTTEITNVTITDETIIETIGKNKAIEETRMVEDQVKRSHGSQKRFRSLS